MILVVLTLAALQDDWSTFEARRELTTVETEGLRKRIYAWAARPGIPELSADTLRIVSAEEVPVYRVATFTLCEKRELVTKREPYRGGDAPVRTAPMVDVWGPPTPAFEGFGDRQWSLPVAGTAELKTCEDCQGRKKIDCSSCRGGGKVDCPQCDGRRTVRCSPCSGNGKVRCTWCLGSGYSGLRSSQRRCNSCGGDGYVLCHSCNRSGRVKCRACSGEGEVQCTGCRGTGKQGCTGCDGQGAVVESIEILITLQTRRTNDLITELDAKWCTRLSLPESGWRSVDAVEKIPDAGLRRRILEKAAEARNGADPLKGQQIRVLRVPVTLARYTLNGFPYEVAVAEGRFVAVDTPAKQWAKARVDEAAHLRRQGKRSEARMKALLALQADPECDEARALMVEASVPVAKRPAAAANDWRPTLLIVLGSIAAVVLAVMVGLKVYLLCRRPTG